MIKFITYQKDVVELYNKYLNNNNGEVSKTLQALEKDDKLPISFMRYFETDDDFRKFFNIDKKLI